MRITISGRKIQFHRNISVAALFLIFFVKVAAQNTMDFTYDDNGNITSRFVVSNPVEDEEKTEEVDSVLSEDDYMFDQMPNMKTGKGTKYSACVAPSPTTGPISGRVYNHDGRVQLVIVNTATGSPTFYNYSGGNFSYDMTGMVRGIYLIIFVVYDNKNKQVDQIQIKIAKK